MQGKERKMDKLEKYLEDVGSIASSLKILAQKELSETALEMVAEKEPVNQVATAPTVPLTPQPPVQAVPTNVQGTMPTQPQVQMPTPVVPMQPQAQVQAQVPVSQTVESFTQEQIARAMANAAQAGRQDIIQNIFATFRVQTLMEINPEHYNQIATMLREAGIQV